MHVCTQAWLNNGFNVLNTRQGNNKELWCKRRPFDHHGCPIPTPDTINQPQASDPTSPANIPVPLYLQCTKVPMWFKFKPLYPLCCHYFIRRPFKDLSLTERPLPYCCPNSPLLYSQVMAPVPSSLFCCLLQFLLIAESRSPCNQFSSSVLNPLDSSFVLT